MVLLNAAIGFGQEYMAERTAEALRAMVPHRARVVRDGERVEVPAAELAVGDVVVLEAGDAVSADCRVIEAHELAVNNMALTGESAPAGRFAERVAAGTARLEARNLVWMGTTVSAGTGKAIVTGTGVATEFGRIYRLTAETSADRSPLQRQTAIMARRVAVAAFALGALLFAVRLPPHPRPRQRSGRCLAVRHPVGRRRRPARRIRAGGPDRRGGLRRRHHRARPALRRRGHARRNPHRRELGRGRAHRRRVHPALRHRRGRRRPRRPTGRTRRGLQLPAGRHRPRRHRHRHRCRYLQHFQ
nr:hypothetical protein [Actinophytocola sp.]